MDVTPRELRDIDIREGFRGYHRDDVDELLERAAATIEGLEREVRELTERLSHAGATAAPATDTEEVHRTLLLAQRVADEAVAEAKAKAEEMIADADARARSAVANAEAEARRVAEAEHARLDAEVRELGARREALVVDVDALERFESDYRARLRRIIESDLEAITKQEPAGGPPRPSLHEIEVSTTEGTHPETPAPASAGSATPWSPPEVPAASPPASTSSEEGGPPTMELSAIGEAVAEPRSSADERPPTIETAVPDFRIDDRVPAPQEPREPLFPDDTAEPESLDDEAFFASLREAVRDDSPLGPRDEDLPERRLFDQDDSRRGLFRRRP